jgi:hypothetical protein
MKPSAPYRVSTDTISWAAILSSTKLAHLVKVVAEAAVVAGLAEAVAGVVVTAEAAVVAGLAEAVVVAEAAVAVAVAGIVAIAVAVAAETGAGNRLPIVKICNETGERANVPRFCFPQISSLSKFRICSMLSLGNSYGYAIHRKRPHSARIEGEAKLVAQTRSETHEANELQPGVSLD